MNYYNYEDWKQAQIEAADKKTKDNLSKTPNAAKDRFNQNNYESGVNYLSPGKADISLFTFIDKKVQFIIRQYAPENKLDLNNLGFDNL